MCKLCCRTCWANALSDNDKIGLGYDPCASCNRHELLTDRADASPCDSCRDGQCWDCENNAENQPEHDGQPDEAQEWADFDRDC